MRWLWFIGPLFLLGTYLLVVLATTAEDRRRRQELTRWLEEWLGPLLGGDGKPITRKVRSLPESLAPMIELCGGGARIADLVLVSKEAYLAVRAADAGTLSDQHTVVCRLANAAPDLVVRPLPIVDGRPLPNRGLTIDDAFGESFIVEGEDAARARAWLDEDVRDRLLDHPDAWLRTRGTSLAVTLYGPLDADRIDELLALADAIHARYGASRTPLFGADSPEDRQAASRRARPTSARASDVAEGEIAEPGARLRAGAIDLALYGLAGALVALANGSLPSFHPLVLFNNPDAVVNEPWQGGFTTKGFGAITASLCLLVGLFVLQSHLAATDGRSIGKWIVGLRVVRHDGRAVDFLRGTLLRQWLPASLVLVAAALLAKPFTTGAMFARVLTYGPLMTGAGLTALGVATLSRERDHRGFHDRLAGTKVVEAQPFRLPALQLASTRGLDPVVFGQVMQALGLGALFLAAWFAVGAFGITVKDVPQEALPLFVFVPVALVQVLRRMTTSDDP